MVTYILIYTDGFNISTSQFDTFEEAFDEMERNYNLYDTGAFNEEYKEQCYIGSNSAAVYNNGEDIFLWQIIEVRV